MTKDEILKAICKVLEEEFECDPSKLNADTTLFEELDLDSIDAVDLVVRLQNMTGLKVKAEDFKQIRTIGDDAPVTEKLMNEKK